MKGKGKYWGISLVFILILGWALPAWALSFAPAVNYSTGGGPYFITTGDFNKDGKPDLAVVDSSINKVSILMGSGNGTFAAAVDYNVGANPVSVAVGDFRNGGHTDLAVANGNDNNISILLGSDDGTFTTPAPIYGAGTFPIFVAVGDFNRDGNLDLAVANFNSSNVSILLGVGDGTFTPASPATITVGSNPYSVAVGDFNRDGKLDLAVANKGDSNVSILLGNGNGTFTPASPATVTVGSNPIFVATGDFNGDGKPDLAVANNLDNNVSILLGNSDGTFAAAVNYGVGIQPTSVVVGDFNGDGKPDLAVTNTLDNNISILLGKGDGTFASAVNYGVGTNPRSVAVGDFNVDGRPDLAIANANGSNVSILLNTTAFELGGAFALPAGYGTGTDPVSVAVGDFDRNGKLDLAVANLADNNVSILLGNGDGTFPATPSGNYGVGSGPVSVAVGDFDRDGKLDLATANQSSDNVTILLGNGAGGFSAASGSPITVGTTPFSVAVGDFDSDGKPDLAVANNGSDNVSILLGNGDGTFTPAPSPTVAVGSGPIFVAVGDFDRDGNLDLAVANYSGTSVSILLGDGAGAFAPATPATVLVGSGPYSVIVGDFNGDGNPDLAVANYGSNNVSILLGNGDGTFATAVNYSTGTAPYSLTAGDFNRDGKLDLATANYGDNNVSILLGNGNGTFQPKVDYGAGTNPIFVTAGDFNGDGKIDLAVANYTNTSVSILQNKPFIINSDEAYATSPTVALHYYPTSDHKYIRTSTGIADPVTGAFWSGWKALPVLPSHNLNLGTTQGYRNVFAQVKNAVGDISPVSRALTFLDTAAPTAVVKINGGAASVLNTGGSTTVRLHMAFFDRNSSGWDGAQMRYSTTAFAANDPSPVWGPYVTGQDVVLSGTGLKKIYVQFMDGADRKSVVYAPSITVSNTGPSWTPSLNTPSLLQLDSGVNYTLDTGVVCTYDLSISPTTTKVRYCFTNSLGVTGWTAWETPSYTGSGPYHCTRNLTLAGGNGLRQVYLQIKDLYFTPNQITDPFPVSIILDTSAPSANVVINNGAASVKQAGTTTTVTLTIAANDAGSGLRYMAINSTGLTPAPGDYVPFASTASYDLNTTTTGVKYVYVWVKDYAGKVSTRKSDSIKVVP